MRNLSPGSLLALAVLLLPVGACGHFHHHHGAAAPEEPAAVEPDAPAAAAPDAVPAELGGTLWAAVELAGEPVPELAGERQVLLEFGPDGRVSGSDGCNRFHGPVHFGPGDGVLEFGPLASTMMACLEGPDVSNRVREALEATRGWKVDGDRLELHGEDGGAPLAVYTRQAPAAS